MPEAQELSEEQIAQKQREMMQQQMKVCAEKIEKALREHGMRIVPYLSQPEPVGEDGSAAILRASYGLAPSRK